MQSYKHTYIYTRVYVCMYVYDKFITFTSKIKHSGTDPEIESCLVM